MLRDRNGAFWSIADLELGELSVRHGPLNWLHEARHVIGTIANTQLVTREEAADRDLDQPHMYAASAICKWTYPTRRGSSSRPPTTARSVLHGVREQRRRLRRSCCLRRLPQGRRRQLRPHAHEERGAPLRQPRPSRRRGHPAAGATGLAEADAQVLRQASMLVERASEQAGPPNIPATEWEQLLAQVLLCAGGS